MSNIYPPPPQIPPLEHERPVRSLKGFVFANEAWHARHDDLWPPKAGEQSPEVDVRAAIDLYLGNFCRPIKSIAMEVRCVACGQDLTTPYGQAAKKSLTQTYLKVDRSSPTLEARCGGCAYPVRCRHTIMRLPPLQLHPLVRLGFFPLCYHPTATERGLHTTLQ